MKNDPRLTNQMNYLYSKHLTRSKYKAPLKAWEHDHCSFCFKKFANATKEECFLTDDKRHLICGECFDDFREMFKWAVDRRFFGVNEINKNNTVPD